MELLLLLQNYRAIIVYTGMHLEGGNGGGVFAPSPWKGQPKSEDFASCLSHSETLALPP